MFSQKGVTLSDVAKLCGVSKATVSAVLNPRSRSNIGFSEQTEKKVRLAAKKLGYRPNRTVRQFFSNRHGSIGLLFPGIYDIPKDTLGYLLKLAKWQDVMLLLEELSVQSEDTPKLIEEDCVDGLVVFGNAGGQWYENLGKLDIPVVEMNTNRRTGPMCITYDEENGSRLLVDRLAERGCKRILKIFPKQSFHYSVDARINGIEKSVEERGLEPSLLIRMDTDRPTSYVQETLAENPDIDAVIVYNAWMALDVYRSADRLGKRVGKDLAVAGFGPTYLGYGLEPSFTMAMVNEREISQKVLDMLTAAIENKVVTQEPVVMQYWLREGESA